MQANYYADFAVATPQDPDLDKMILRNQVYHILHGAFRQLPATFALALPKKKPEVLRVFAATADQLMQLIAMVKQHWTVRDYAVISPIHDVSAHQGPWASYKRFRIPTAKSDRNAKDGHSSLKERRLREAQHQRMPYLQIISSSTKQRFTLFVQQVAAEQAGDGLPDGYGLARADQPFALPDLP